MIYQLPNGQTLTDEDIEKEAREYEEGTWVVTLNDIKVGRPALSDEKLVTVPVRFPASMVAEIDRRSTNRSDFIRRAVASCL